MNILTFPVDSTFEGPLRIFRGGNFILDPDLPSCFQVIFGAYVYQPTTIEGISLEEDSTYLLCIVRDESGTTITPVYVRPAPSESAEQQTVTIRCASFTAKGGFFLDTTYFIQQGSTATIVREDPVNTVFQIAKITILGIPINLYKEKTEFQRCINSEG